MKKIYIYLSGIALAFGFYTINFSYGQTLKWKIFKTTNSGIPDNSIRTIAEDSAGNKWIGTMNGGIGVVDKDTIWTVYNKSNSGLPENFVSSIAFGASGVKWIGTSAGLAKFAGGTTLQVWDASNSILTNPIVYDVAVDKDGVKWVALFFGLAKFDDTNWTLFNHSNSQLNDLRIFKLALDKEDSLWIGDCSGYIIKYNRASSWRVFTAADGLNAGNRVNSIIFTKDDNVLAGFLGSKAARYDGSRWTFYAGMIDNTVYSIAEDKNGNIWFGTQNGLMKYKDGFWTIYKTSNSPLPNNAVNALYIDKDGSIWIGTDDGLALLSFIDTTSSDNHIDEVNNSADIFPNPANSVLNVRNSFTEKGNSKKAYLAIYNTLGQEITQYPISSNQESIDINSLGAGIYSYKIFNNNSVLNTGKLVIKR